MGAVLIFVIVTGDDHGKVESVFVEGEKTKLIDGFGFKGEAEAAILIWVGHAAGVQAIGVCGVKIERLSLDLIPIIKEQSLFATEIVEGLFMARRNQDIVEGEVEMVVIIKTGLVAAASPASAPAPASTSAPASAAPPRAPRRPRS